MNNVYCIIGLGNPGAKYYNTRHNTGFTVIDKLARFFNIESFIIEESYLYAITEYKEKQVVLMKPLTFMNASGRAVKDFYDKYEISLENMLVVYDDVNLDFGVLRLRPSGSDGGQNGIKSVIYEMETENIPRLRIGIKNEAELEKVRQNESYDLAGYVLTVFTDEELKELDKIADTSKDAVLSFINKRIETAMNIHNKRISGENNNN